MPVRVRRIVKQEIDVPGLGGKIKAARESDNRSVTEIAKMVGISRNYWYQLEAEAVMGGVAEDTLRKIEQVLGANFGVQFEAGIPSRIPGMPKGLPGVDSHPPGLPSPNVPGLPDASTLGNTVAANDSREDSDIDQIQAAMFKNDDAGNTVDTK